MTQKGGKRPPPFLLATWGSGGRRFKSSRSNHKHKIIWSDHLILENLRFFCIVKSEYQ